MDVAATPSYSVTNVIYNARKATKGAWGFVHRKRQLQCMKTAIYDLQQICRRDNSSMPTIRYTLLLIILFKIQNYERVIRELFSNSGIAPNP